MVFGPPPRRLVELPRYVVEQVFAVWRSPDYPGFVRFLFAVAIEQPQNREAIRLLYDTGIEVGARYVAARFVESGEITIDELRHLLRAAANGLGCALIEEYLLYGYDEPSAGTREYGEELVRFLGDALRYREGKRKR